MEKFKLYITLSDMERFLSTRREVHARNCCCEDCIYEALCAAYDGNDIVQLIVVGDSLFDELKGVED